ncbi:hypothetical protein [Devosia sp. RR2S18]|uniref:hypothetical protein n=1 Tax=Devosia rhizosphaerae TaxID=3049774 RepID=UPI00253FD9C8|nr:hypothetical protein [Devosia sp. RR2S18]WIJ26981.1 hypothetical protein QOV41_09640 [Devosia sp. RR2S18]
MNEMKHWAGPEVQTTGVDGAEAAGSLDPQTTADLLIIGLRDHPHFNNVLTHVLHADRPLAQKSMERLLRLEDEAPLTSLEANLVSLLCGERGVTGKMMRPWVAAQLRRLLSEQDASRIEHTWHAWHTLNMLLPVRFRTSAMPALRHPKK